MFFFPLFFLLLFLHTPVLKYLASEEKVKGVDLLTSISINIRSNAGPNQSAEGRDLWRSQTPFHDCRCFHSYYLLFFNVFFLTLLLTNLSLGPSRREFLKPQLAHFAQLHQRLQCRSLQKYSHPSNYVTFCHIRAKNLNAFYLRMPWSSA